MTLFSKGKKKSDFYDVLPIHTILLDIFLRAQLRAEPGQQLQINSLPLPDKIIL